MNKYQFFAERKKLPPTMSRILIGKDALTFARSEGTIKSIYSELPPTFWNMQSKS